MSNFNLSATDIRIIGCLMEKSIFTPDVYPLTLNSLTTACNQKSSREPVMNLSPGEVQQAARGLKEKHLLRIEENFKNGVEKYAQTFCNTNFGDIQFSAAQFAIICLLLLRGPQTPGELRTRSNRLHSFDDNQEVVEVLAQLMNSDGKPLVIKLPRRVGRKDCEYMHLLAGPIDPALLEEARPSSTAQSGNRTTMSDLIERVEQLEAEVAKLKEQLAEQAS